MMKYIAIHSVPRSGSTWLGSIFDSHPEVIYKYQPLFSYAFKSALSPHSTTDEIARFFQQIATRDDDFLDQMEAKKRGVVPQFKKTTPRAVVYKEVRYHHLLENLLSKQPELRLITLIRHPLATLYSWWKAPKEFRADLGWQFTEEWKWAPKKNQGRPEEYNGYEKWKEAAYLFEQLQSRWPERCMIVTYAELLHDTETTVRTLFGRCGLDFADQTAAFIAKSKSSAVDDAYGVYKTKRKDNAWQGQLSQSIVSYVLKDLKDTALEKYLQE